MDYAGRFLRRRLSLVNSENDSLPEDVFAGSGAAIFCRRAMLCDVAYRGEVYDETFFAYVEDLDLAWRAQLRGWRCVFAPDVRGVHVGSASMGGRIRVLDKPPCFQRHILKNRYLTVVKNATPGIAATLLPGLLLAEVGIWGGLSPPVPAAVGADSAGHGLGLAASARGDAAPARGAGAAHSRRRPDPIPDERSVTWRTGSVRRS